MTALVTLAVVAALVGAALWLEQRPRLRELGPSQRLRLRGDLSRADDPAVASWEAYLEREERVFAELEEKLVRDGGGELLDRYRRDSPSYPGRQPVDGNRSFELEAPNPRGAVLLIHGLSDSPYSVRPLARLFVRHGLTAVAPRLPGHGTAPGELRHRHRRTWRAAVELGARRAAERAGEGPIYLAGYSLGAALALDLLLRRRWPEAAALPERIFLLSPALGLRAPAWLADLDRLYGFLPGFEGSRWVHVDPEYDPFKYNSFPTYAGGQARRLVREVHRRLRHREAVDLPPITAFQSVEDATVDPRPLLAHFSRRFAAGSELVLFDRNRHSPYEPLRRPRADLLPTDAEAAAGLGYELTRVMAAGPAGAAVARRWRAGGGESHDEALTGRWPAQVHSLSHVALAFPPDDPLYGGDEADGPGPPLGRMAPRGERGRLTVPAGHLLRLRFNPFFEVVERRIGRWFRDSATTPE